MALRVTSGVGYSRTYRARQVAAALALVATAAAHSRATAAPTMRRDDMAVEDAPGATRWVIAEGYIPAESHGPEPQMISHETACILNAGDADAHVRITLYFTDREPVGPYEVIVPARRTRHLRFNDLEDPGTVPRGTDFASVIESDVPIVVQHTRLDSRQAELALLSTVAYPG